MDGVECVRLMQLKNLAIPPAVIMATAEYGQDEALASAQQSSTLLRSVLTKPISAAMLLRAFTEALGEPAELSSRPIVPTTRQADAAAEIAWGEAVVGRRQRTQSGTRD